MISLELSLFNMLLPDAINLDRQYFNMIEVKTEEAFPKWGSGGEGMFERKPGDNFLSVSSGGRELKMGIKQHLKICNCVLMYTIIQKKNDP